MRCVHRRYEANHWMDRVREPIAQACLRVFRHDLRRIFPIAFGLWQSTALLWMGPPLVDGTS